MGRRRFVSNWFRLAVGLPAVVVAMVAVGLGLATAGTRSASSVPSRLPARVRLLGATPGATPVSFSLVLRLHQDRLNRFLSGLYKPGSPVYHDFIDAHTFGRRFGISGRQLRRLRRALRLGGIRVTTQYPQRTALDVMAPAGAVERFFRLRLVDYLGASGRRFHSPASAPVIPAGLRAEIVGVAGLHGAELPRPDDVPANGVTPAMGASAYDITPLYSQGIKGQGETVAVVESSQFAQADLNSFTQQFGLPTLNPQNVSTPQDGAANDTSNTGEEETELDMELIHEVAPDATILDYNAPDTTSSGADSLADMLDNIVSQGRVSIVSDSMGYCELGFPSADIQHDEQAIEAAVAHGISIFKSTGDAGAYQCERFNSSDHRLSVEWPASSPGVIAVGGTSLSVSATGAYAGETAWEDALENSGGGGGLSTVFPLPSWQSAPGVSNQFSDGKRQIPDVSADADPNSGWALYTGGSLGPTAGTSAAAPFWAGTMALIEQYARQHGVSNLGFVDPTLYRLAATAQPFPPFHDVTIGTNRYYPATPGWDFATGLGSPDVYNLARDIVRLAKRR